MNFNINKLYLCFQTTKLRVSHYLLQNKKYIVLYKVMEKVEKFIVYIFNVLLFVVLSILFLPSFLIVTYIQPIWSKMLTNLFKL